MENTTYTRADLIELALSKYTKKEIGIDIFSLIKRKRDIKRVASSLILKVENSDSVFYESHITILRDAIHYCINKENTTNKDLSDFLKLSANEMLEKIGDIKGCKNLKTLLSTKQGEIFLSSAYRVFEVIHSIADNKSTL